MYKPNGEVSGVLDWEMVALGDPCQDLAWGIAIDDCNSDGINVPKLQGIPTRDETVKKWEELYRFSRRKF